MDDRRSASSARRFLAKVIRLTNAGTKTVSEVSLLLDDIQDGRIVPPAPFADADLEAAEAVEDAASDLSDPRFDEFVIDVLKGHPLSARAERILGLASLRNLRVRDFALDGRVVSKRIVGVPNIGRRSVGEVEVALIAQVDRIRNGSPAEVVVEDPRPPRERLISAISSLNEKKSDVLCRRYGLDGQEPQTLQEIAVGVHVTRERVRQVEAKALRRLQKVPAATAVRDFTSAEQDTQWVALAGSKSRVDEDELSERTKSVDPLFRIAVDAQHGSLRTWLDGFATRTDTGWTRHSKDRARLGTVTDALNAVVRSRPCPIPLSSLGPEIGKDIGLLNDIGLLEDGSSIQGKSIFEGYLCVGYLGARMRRRVRLHVVALDIAVSGYFDVGSLIKAYRARHPDDTAGSRVLLKEMDAAPHLFLCIFDYLWRDCPGEATHVSDPCPSRTARSARMRSRRVQAPPGSLKC